MNRIKGLIIILGGVILMVLGLGMWESPEMNWQGFLAAWAIVGRELLRLKGDPFALLGILVLVVGLIITYQGFKRLVRG